VNATIERDTGEHSVHWDQNNDDLSYGRHTPAHEVHGQAAKGEWPNGQLTVAAILYRRTPDEILAPHPEHDDEPVSVSEIIRRLSLERLGEYYDTSDATSMIDKAVITAWRPEPTTGVWWDRDSTPTGVILTDYRPDRKQHHDPDETVGFMPLAEPPPDPRFKLNPEPTGPFFATETKVGDFAPIDTRVKKIPWYKQMYYGLFTKKGAQDLR